jgi:hypothetical protein
MSRIDQLRIGPIRALMLTHRNIGEDPTSLPQGRGAVWSVSLRSTADRRRGKNREARARSRLLLSLVKEVR